MRCCLAPQAPPNLSPWLFVLASNITCTTWRLLATQPDLNWLYPAFSTAAEVALTMTPKPMSTLVIFTVVNFQKRPYNVRFRSSFIVSASPCTKIKPFLQDQNLAYLQDDNLAQAENLVFAVRAEAWVAE